MATNTPASNQQTRPRPQPRPQKAASTGGTAGLVLGIIALLLAIGAGVYAWLNTSEYENQAAELRSRVKFLENRLNNTENAIVQITSGEEIVPATSGGDANVVINAGKEAPDIAPKKAATPSKAGKATSPVKKRAAVKTQAKRTSRAGRRSQTQSVRYSNSAPKTFGNTYTPPSTVHYAVLIDAFGSMRQAKITQALFAMRHGAYIRKVGASYNVYAGWYTDINDARRMLRHLQDEYGPSCRIVTLYD